MVPVAGLANTCEERNMSTVQLQYMANKARNMGQILLEFCKRYFILE